MSTTRNATISTVRNSRPLYVRVLRLRHIRPGPMLCFLYSEGAFAVGVLLALAEFIPWWMVPVLVLVVAAMVKLNDMVAGAASSAMASRPDVLDRHSAPQRDDKAAAEQSSEGPAVPTPSSGGNADGAGSSAGRSDGAPASVEGDSADVTAGSGPRDTAARISAALPVGAGGTPSGTSAGSGDGSSDTSPDGSSDGTAGSGDAVAVDGADGSGDVAHTVVTDVTPERAEPEDVAPEETASEHVGEGGVTLGANPAGDPARRAGGPDMPSNADVQKDADGPEAAQSGQNDFRTTEPLPSETSTDDVVTGNGNHEGVAVGDGDVDPTEQPRSPDGHAVADVDDVPRATGAEHDPSTEPAGMGAQEKASRPAAAPDDAVPDDAVPDDAVPDDAVPDDAVPDDAVPDDAVPDDAVPDDAVPDDAVPDDAVPDDAAPDDAAPDADDDTAELPLIAEPAARTGASAVSTESVPVTRPVATRELVNELIRAMRSSRPRGREGEGAMPTGRTARHGAPASASAPSSEGPDPTVRLEADPYGAPDEALQEEATSRLSGERPERPDVDQTPTSAEEPPGHDMLDRTSAVSGPSTGAPGARPAPVPGATKGRHAPTADAGDPTGPAAELPMNRRRRTVGPLVSRAQRRAAARRAALYERPTSRAAEEDQSEAPRPQPSASADLDVTREIPAVTASPSIANLNAQQPAARASIAEQSAVTERTATPPVKVRTSPRRVRSLTLPVIRPAVPNGDQLSRMGARVHPEDTPEASAGDPDIASVELRNGEGVASERTEQRPAAENQSTNASS